MAAESLTFGLRAAAIDRRQLVALSLPVVVPVAMSAVFAVSRARLGDQAGYVAGFSVYWGSCAALGVALLGRRRVRDLFRDRRPRFGRPAALGVALLVWPPAGAIATRFIPEIGEATPLMLATIAGVAVANAVLEELLWRGLYVTLWPRNPWLGWMWPAVGFGAFHFAPQVIHPSPLGPVWFVAAATVMGLSWGWVAYQSGTLRWVGASHLLTDGSGLRNALLFIGP